MKILFVVSEAYPFIKTGGLGDVGYALPKALLDLNQDVRVILPKYSNIPEKYTKSMVTLSTFNVQVGWRNQYCGLQYLKHNGISFYFIDNEYYFKRDVAYGYYDDGERFAFYSRAVLEAVRHMDDFKPDIIHCNDWHTAAVPVLLKANYPDLSDIKTVFTIHNLQYQGVMDKSILSDLLNLDEYYFDENRLKYHDAISLMKGGINYSDIITTVSETYAEEIKQPFYGEGLHGLLASKGNNLKGIVNGIDYDLFNPEIDQNIYFNFNSSNIENKLNNKMALQKDLGFAVNKNIPMIGIISRLVKQKGFDLVSCVMEEILQMNVQLVVLGTGDPEYENMFKYHASTKHDKVSANIFYDDILARKIYAASDLFLMPSLFEPCGIGQLIAMRYGSLPIVRETGGLKDTVKPFNEFLMDGNGFSFANYNAHDMLYTIKRALSFYSNKSLWKVIVQNALAENNSWETSAKKYIDLYSSLL